MMRVVRRRLGLGRVSSNDGSFSGLFPIEGDIGMKILVEPSDPSVEYVPSFHNSKQATYIFYV
jgi:hypothetical protein